MPKSLKVSCPLFANMMLFINISNFIKLFNFLMTFFSWEEKMKTREDKRMVKLDFILFSFQNW